MTTIHIMLDLETWGTTPGSDIRSIGACMFHPTTGYVGCRGDDYQPSIDGTARTPTTFYLATDNPSSFPYDWGDRGGVEPRRYALTRDPKTEQWWGDQSTEAQAAFANPVELRQALEQFEQWLASVVDPLNPSNHTLWSHGSHFDVPILAAAYAACNLPVPWHYRAPRDTRTAFDMAGITDHSAWLDQHTIGNEVHHHALGDAIVQARAVCAAYSVLRDGPAGLPLHDAYQRAKQAVENYYDATDMNYTMGEACDAGPDFIKAADDLMNRAKQAFAAITDAKPK